MTAYIHELPDWPHFQWDEKHLAVKVAAVRYRQGRMLGALERLGIKLREEAILRTLTEEVVKSSEIEGEIVLVQRELEFSGSSLRDNLVANQEWLLRLSLPIFCASLPGFRELAFTVCQYLRGLACQLVSRGNVADGTVQAMLVVIIDVVRYQPPGLVEIERRLRANALGLQALMPPLQLAVALRIVRRSPNMIHALDPNEGFEILGHKLRPIV